MSRRRKPDGRRVKLYAGLIRQVRGRPILEALHRLQGGTCAYDDELCVLLLPQAVGLYSYASELKPYRSRFSTIDHVQPRFLGGQNEFCNLVMASQVRNNEKGCLEPQGRWLPHLSHTNDDILKAIRMVEATRVLQAHKFAENRKLNRQDVIDKIIERELRLLSSKQNFKFYEESLAA